MLQALLCQAKDPRTAASVFVKTNAPYIVPALLAKQGKLIVTEQSASQSMMSVKSQAEAQHVKLLGEEASKDIASTADLLGKYSLALHTRNLDRSFDKTEEGRF